ncbi:GNAT family N-acetyltransferase [uncultured Caballeronia sp.]|jgi:putative acetyltransferase|uniref:GNAT family N-acetyltransferase n=1 Tax=uncultured Caballeronia sp. TaxID=1827198 RepID=UPI0035C9DDFC
MAIVIRRYEPSDLDAVINVFLRAIREVASRDYDAAQIDAWAQADRDVWARRRLDRPTWLALVDGAVAGFGDLQSDGHIDMLFVHPEHQRAGAANALLDQIESEARNQHLAIIDTEPNRPAVLRSARVRGRPVASRGSARRTPDQLPHAETPRSGIDNLSKRV